MQYSPGTVPDLDGFAGALHGKDFTVILAGGSDGDGGEGNDGSRDGAVFGAGHGGITPRRRALIHLVDVLLVCCVTLLVVAVAWFPTVWSFHAWREGREADASINRVAKWPEGKAADEYRRAQGYNRRIAASDQATLGEFEDPFDGSATASSPMSNGSERPLETTTGPLCVDSGAETKKSISSSNKVVSDSSELSDSLASCGRLDGRVRPQSQSDTEYRSLLNDGTGAMGAISIPKISVNMPIYHGTSDDALLHGAGHLYGTSLPVGGPSTNAVLSGHRGLTGALMFTRLDELKPGDILYVRTLGRVMGYRVTAIHVIDPDDTHLYRVVPGRDLVTLMTCTPYGVNTQRLVVTAERQSIPDPIPDPSDAKGDPLLVAFMTMFILLVFPSTAIVIATTVSACRHPVPTRHRA